MSTLSDSSSSMMTDSMNSKAAMQVPENADLQIVESTNTYIVAQSQGGRDDMQDAHVAIPDLKDGKALFAVFDGHGKGGTQASRLAAQHFPRILQSHPLYSSQPSEALRETNRQTDDLLLQEVHNDRGGTTAVACLVDSTSGKIFCSNVGDSRAVLYTRRDNRVHGLTKDHKPSDPEEKERVEEAGGEIIYHHGWRVQGALNMTRALGDRQLTPYGVVGEPDITSCELTSRGDLLIVACDGVWDALKHHEAIQIVAEHLKDLKMAASLLNAECRRRGSTDNITMVIVKVGVWTEDQE